VFPPEQASVHTKELPPADLEKELNYVSLAKKRVQDTEKNRPDARTAQLRTRLKKPSGKTWGIFEPHWAFRPARRRILQCSPGIVTMRWPCSMSSECEIFRLERIKINPLPQKAQKAQKEGWGYAS
jgi:hypothetical protein